MIDLAILTTYYLLLTTYYLLLTEVLMRKKKASIVKMLRSKP